MLVSMLHVPQVRSELSALHSVTMMLYKYITYVGRGAEKLQQSKMVVNCQWITMCVILIIDIFKHF